METKWKPIKNHQNKETKRQKKNKSAFGYSPAPYSMTFISNHSMELSFKCCTLIVWSNLKKKHLFNLFRFLHFRCFFLIVFVFRMRIIVKTKKEKRQKKYVEIVSGSSTAYARTLSLIFILIDLWCPFYIFINWTNERRKNYTWSTFTFFQLDLDPHWLDSACVPVFLCIHNVCYSIPQIAEIGCKHERNFFPIL